MIKHLDTSNPDARILLLEHGRSYRSWLNNILDNSAEKHAEMHGCWFNRDIGELVRDVAAKTSFEVEGERRRHFGTTWVFELKPSADLVKRSNAVAEEVAGPESEQSRSWLSWIAWK